MQFSVVSTVTPIPADRNSNNNFSLTPTRPIRPSYSKRLNNFDVQLLRDTAETSTSSNFMISPASIKSVLIMILEGARGNTAEEIRSVLRLPSDLTETRNLLNGYLSKLQVYRINIHLLKIKKNISKTFFYYF